jgi:hypothetical protein
MPRPSQILLLLLIIIIIIMAFSLGHHRDMEGALSNYDDSDAYAVEADVQQVKQR